MYYRTTARPVKRLIVMLCLDPPSSSLRLAVAQPLVVPGNIDANLHAMTPMVRRARQESARLILFSECGLTGYDLRGRAIATAIRFDDPALTAIDRLAADHRMVIVQGFYERDGDAVYNSAAAFFPEGTRILQRKHRIIDYEARQTPVRSALRKRQVFEIDGFRCAILICADNGIDGIHGELAQQGVNIVLAPTAGCGDLSWTAPLEGMASAEALRLYVERARAVCFIDPSEMIRHRMAMACCNQAGYVPDSEFFHPGHSAVIDHTGETTALIPGQPAPELLRPQLAVGFVTPNAEGR